MTNRPVKRMRVFAIESPSALDVLANRTESETLRAICKLLGHDFASTIVRSFSEFTTALNHVASIDVKHLPPKSQKRPLCLHIASHGNDDGLTFGSDDASWKKLAAQLWQSLSSLANYPGPTILVISACGAEEQTITKYFTKKAKDSNAPKPPAYVLATVSNDSGDVYWRDAVVAWSIFYHQIGAAVLTKREDIQTILDKITLVGAGALKYFRWDNSKKHYASFESDRSEHRHSPKEKAGRAR